MSEAGGPAVAAASSSSESVGPVSSPARRRIDGWVPAYQAAAPRAENRGAEPLVRSRWPTPPSSRSDHVPAFSRSTSSASSMVTAASRWDGHPRAATAPGASTNRSIHGSSDSTDAPAKEPMSTAGSGSGRHRCSVGAT